MLTSFKYTLTWSSDFFPPPNWEVYQVSDTIMALSVLMPVKKKPGGAENTNYTDNRPCHTDIRFPNLDPCPDFQVKPVRNSGTNNSITLTAKSCPF